MQVYRDLIVEADAEQMSRAINKLPAHLPAGWSRSRVPQPFVNRTFFGFECTPEKNRPAATLYLADKDQQTFHISSIVPTQRHQLKYEEYNAVLADFYERVFQPCAELAALPHYLTEPEAELEQWLDPSSANLLREFSATPNKGTAAMHPRDRARWHAFLQSAFQNDSRMDEATLERWLVEVEGWPPAIAEVLALEYKSGLGLLKYYVNSH